MIQYCKCKCKHNLNGYCNDYKAQDDPKNYCLIERSKSKNLKDLAEGKRSV